MRKKNPADVRSGFAAEVDGLTAYFERLSAGRISPGDLSRLSATTFLSAFVAFERFLSDLFLAYLNRQFAAYRSDLEKRVRQSVSERYGSWAGKHVNLTPVRHVSVAELEALIDPKSRNLTFSTAQDLKQKAESWLSAPHRSRVTSISVHDERLVDTARAIRNFIAHDSRSSKSEMNRLLATVEEGAHNRYLGRSSNKVNNVGTYLKAAFTGKRRVVIYAERLRTISQGM